MLPCDWYVDSIPTITLSEKPAGLLRGCRVGRGKLAPGWAWRRTPPFLTVQRSTSHSVSQFANVEFPFASTEQPRTVAGMTTRRWPLVPAIPEASGVVTLVVDSVPPNATKLPLTVRVSAALAIESV